MGDAKESEVYACVDTFSVITLPDDAYPLIRSLDELDGDVWLILDGMPPGMYRKVDGKLIGWLEWKIWQAKKVKADKKHIAEVEEFVKLLKSGTGLKADSVDISYQRPLSRLLCHMTHDEE